MLDLTPDSGSLAHARAQPIRALQVVAGMQVAGQWGGMIDVTRESVSVIDQANSVMDTPTRVDPAPFRLAPFRLARFSKWGAL